jgi:hypothetical protein
MKTSLFVLFTLICFALSPAAIALLPPPAPDGGYPGANTAEGNDALLHLTTGSDNTAIGFEALFSNLSGHDNTALGFDALNSNTTGYANTAAGVVALSSNSTGHDNTAIGVQALNNNNVGVSNTATGFAALGNNTSAGNNTATGFNALRFNETGFRNTADGSQALYSNSGPNNVGLGFNAGYNLTTGSNNVCIGSGVLGNPGESNTTRIRNVYISMASGRAVYVNSDNKIGTLVSSRRFKDEIKPMDKASEAILALKPVTFRYKKEIEPNRAIMFGLIAEDVEEVEPELMTRSENGEVETVRYEAVNAMLLNEFLKEHRTVRELRSTVQKQQIDFQSKLAQQQKQIEALTAGLQKVSAQIELSKPAPQTVLNNH